MALGTTKKLGKVSPAKIAAIVVMLLIGAGGFYWNYSTQHPAGVASGPVKSWYYDLKTKELFPSTTRSPRVATAPSGAEGVRAHVFSSADCSGTDKRIAYLERWTPEMAKAMDAIEQNKGAPPDPASIALMADGDQISLPDAPDHWISKNTPEGMALVAKAQAQENGSTWRECSP